MNEELLTKKDLKVTFDELSNRGIINANWLDDSFWDGKKLEPYIKKHPEICVMCKRRYICLVDLTAKCPTPEESHILKMIAEEAIKRLTK